MFLQLGEEGQVIELHCEYDRFFGLTERDLVYFNHGHGEIMIYGAGTQMTAIDWAICNLCIDIL